MSVSKAIVIFCIIIGSAFPGFSKSIPPLEREITLVVKHEHIEKILLKIEEISKVKFSYSPDIFTATTPLSIEVKQKTVREALSVLLPNNIIFLAKGNYIILKKKQISTNTKTTKVTGYVYDGTTNTKLSHVTIYDKKSLQSATTDDYGYYSLSVPASNDTVFITKESYSEKIIHIDSIKRNSLLTITINPSSDSINKQDSGFWKSKLLSLRKSTNHFAKNLKGYINSINVKDTINRNFQISVLPFIGTNHKLSGNVINKVSINVLGGYSRGVNGFELGGLLNINKNNMHGLQIGGLANVVGENTEGVQIAGLLNNNYKNINGFGLAGISNYIRDTTKGMILSGIANFSGTANKSFELAGIVNITRHANQNFQIAGIANYATEGKTNIQIAGIYNYSKINQGIQVALINCADSSSGVPIGLISFVKKGIHQLEISGDEVFYTNVSFRTGAYKFYNLFTIGCSPVNIKNTLWSVGYGVGTSFKLNSKLRSDITLSLNHISKGDFLQETSELYKLYWGIERRLKSKITIAFGPTFNVYVVDNTMADYKLNYESIAPYAMFKSNPTPNHTVNGWIGARLSIRFF